MICRHSFMMCLIVIAFGFFISWSTAESDELNVPYVPYVVVNKNKDEFDYDRLQQTIVSYLESRANQNAFDDSTVKHTTTLYDYLKANNNDNNMKIHQSYPTDNVDAQYVQFKPSYKLNFADEVTDHTSSSVDFSPLPLFYNSTQVITNTYPNISSFNTHYSSSFPSFTESIIIPDEEFSPDEAIIYPTSKLHSVHMLSSFDSKIPRKGIELGPSFSLPYAGEMKCSLRSSRYVYDGDCKSTKPVVETVCAERCIKYEYNKFDNNRELIIHNTNPYRRAPRPKQIKLRKKQVIALKCIDGDVRKQKIKLYCKDGTIINNIIRTVSSCICQEHNEKVHSTKRNVKSNKKSPGKLSMMINKKILYDQRPSSQRLLVRRHY